MEEDIQNYSQTVMFRGTSYDLFNNLVKKETSSLLLGIIGKSTM